MKLIISSSENKTFGNALRKYADHHTAGIRLDEKALAAADILEHWNTVDTAEGIGVAYEMTEEQRAVAVEALNASMEEDSKFAVKLGKDPMSCPSYARAAAMIEKISRM